MPAAANLDTNVPEVESPPAYRLEWLDSTHTGSVQELIALEKKTFVKADSWAGECISILPHHVRTSQDHVEADVQL